MSQDMGMVENREQQKTRYQGVVHVTRGNSCMSFGSPGSGLCVPALQIIRLINSYGAGKTE